MVDEILLVFEQSVTGQSIPLLTHADYGSRFFSAGAAG